MFGYDTASYNVRVERTHTCFKWLHNWTSFWAKTNEPLIFTIQGEIQWENIQILQVNLGNNYNSL